jgi:hypothetical protein
MVVHEEQRDGDRTESEGPLWLRTELKRGGSVSRSQGLDGRIRGGVVLTDEFALDRTTLTGATKSKR